MVILFSVPSHGRHQMGPNSGVQWDRIRELDLRRTWRSSAYRFSGPKGDVQLGVFQFPNINQKMEQAALQSLYHAGEPYKIGSVVEHVLASRSLPCPS